MLIFKRLWLPYRVFSKKPVSQLYGLDRGDAIDRYYIESFLQKEKTAIKGVCLEILNNEYTKIFGGKRVTKSDALDINTKNIDANIYGDLRNLTNVKTNTYDCIILTQTIHVIDDPEAVLKECYRILKKGGTVLATMPTMSRLDVAAGEEDDFWRYTPAGARKLFSKVFDASKISVMAQGNVLSGIGFWAGLAQQDLDKKTLAYNDSSFPISVGVRAVK